MTVPAAANYTQTSGTTTVDGTLTTTGIVDIQAGSSLLGTGNVNSNTTNAGSTGPGTSAGQLTVTGNYTQTSAGTLDIELGGTTVATQYDQLIVTGTAPTFRWIEVYAANGTINTSDRRRKRDIRDIDYGLDELQKLKPVRYRWKDHPERGERLGLIAQDVQEVISEVVNVGNDKDQTLGVYYSDLIPVLIKGVQEQQAMIERQGNEIEELRKMVRELGLKTAGAEADVDPTSVSLERVTDKNDKS